MAKLVFWRRQPVTEVTRSTTRQVTKRRDNTSYLPLFPAHAPRTSTAPKTRGDTSPGTEAAERGAI